MQAPGRFIDDEDSGLPSQLGEKFQPFFCLAREKAYKYRIPGNPDMDKAVRPAWGPGIAVTGISASQARATRAVPGSEKPGVPASLTKATERPDFNCCISSGAHSQIIMTMVTDQGFGYLVMIKQF